MPKKLTQNKLARQILVKITPRASKNEIVGELPDGTLKIKITATPEGGEANDALIKFLSAEWKIPKSKLHIKSGHTSRTKLLEILD